MLILDTNVVSELMSPRCSPVVLRVLGRFSTQTFATTVISEAELRRGASLLPQGRRRRELTSAIEKMLAEGLGGRVLPFERKAAEAYAALREKRARAGRPISVFDAMIAAICHATDNSLATRNIRDFQDCGVELIDPWTDS